MSAGADPSRFLDWVRDPHREPLDPDPHEVAVAGLVHAAFAWAQARHARSVGDAAMRQMDCRSGCDHCCFIPVSTTAAEVLVAWRHAQANLSPADLDAVRAQAARAPGDAPLPCPFLIDRRCSVYAARPLACRAWNSTDVDACERAHALGHDRVSIPVLTVSRGVYANAAQALARGIAERGGTPVVDLRAALRALIAET